MFSSSDRSIVGFPTIFLQSVESTNQYASDLIAKSKPTEGTVVMAAYQSKGKGQIGRQWHSLPNKNLTFSIILKPKFLPVDDQFSMTLMSSLAIVEFLESFDVENIAIKWPNDIYVEKNKIAGILIQNQILAKRIIYTIIGMGININQEIFPASIGNPTSLYNLTKRYHDLALLSEELFAILEKYYRRMKNTGFRDLFDQYHSRLYLKDELAFFERTDGTRFQGRIRKVNSNGLLVMDLAEGRHSFHLNEFKYLQ